MAKIRVLVAGQRKLICESLCAMLENYDSIEVTSTVSAGEDIVTVVKELCPDVILMDIDTLTADNKNIIHEIRDHCDNVKILAVSDSENWENVLRALEAGCNGYTTKMVSSRELVSCISAVHKWGCSLCPSVAKTFVEEYLRLDDGSSITVRYYRLTGREKEVLNLVANGYKSREIAKVLQITPNTVQRHRTNVMRKLGVASRSELVKWVRQQNPVEKELIMVTG